MTADVCHLADSRRQGQWESRGFYAAAMDRKALILGTGLIGASIGMALRGVGWEVSGWDPDPKSLAIALSRGAIARVSEENSREMNKTGLVVLAAPPSQILEALGAIRTDTLVTDVAGVKGPIVEAARHLPHFIGGHPMAGAVSSGPEMASSHMFHGASWVLCTDNADDSDLDELASIVESIGANPMLMTAAEHDAAVARMSHLPHILATALMSVAAVDARALGLAGGGFRDLTRVAGSDRGWWPELLVTNRAHIETAISELGSEIAKWRTDLGAGDFQAVMESLETASRARRELGEHHAQVRVVLHDRPGEIARVGHALESSRANVRDFQLRHGEHGGGGILTISVTPATVERLRSALLEMGLKVDE